MGSLVSGHVTGNVMAVRRRNATRAARKSVRVRTSRIVLFVLAAFGVSLFYVWSHTQVVQATFALSNLRKQERILSAKSDKLELEIATLRSPARLSKAAAEQLEMVPPDPDQIVMVK